MFSTLRTRFGIPGVISVMALVFAMFGGAYAASNSADGGKATASAKGKKGPRGPKGPAGPAGPQGPAGPAGPAGAQGPKGDAGTNGSNGSNGTPGGPGQDGKSVVTTPFTGEEEIPSFEGPCNGAGGSEVEVEGSGEVENICNGKNGTGASVLTGVWAVGGEKGTVEQKAPLQTAISYGQQIEPAPKLVYVPVSGGRFEKEASFFVAPVIDTETGTVSEYLFASGDVEAHCGSGTAANPSAEPGNLCVFPKTEELLVGGFSELVAANPSPFWTSPDPESGAVLPFEVGASTGYVKGSWAVNVK